VRRDGATGVAGSAAAVRRGLVGALFAEILEALRGLFSLGIELVGVRAHLLYGARLAGRTTKIPCSRVCPSFGNRVH
jgi:hypothetical protein